MIASIKFLFGVAILAVGAVVMIKASLRPGPYEQLLFWRALGLVNVLYGAWLIRRNLP